MTKKTWHVGTRIIQGRYDREGMTGKVLQGRYDREDMTGKIWQGTYDRKGLTGKVWQSVECRVQSAEWRVKSVSYWTVNNIFYLFFPSNFACICIHGDKICMHKLQLICQHPLCNFWTKLSLQKSYFCTWQPIPCCKI